MGKRLCILHANCQGPPLLDRLMLSPDFSANYECTVFTNYTREPVPESTLARCSLFLYQHLGPGWGPLASESLLRQLPPDAEHLCIPNMFFKGYWPMWSGESGFDYRCTHLEKYLSMGLPPEQTVMLFLRSDVTRHYDLLELVSESIALERERESHTPIPYLEVIKEGYRDQRLFNTVNHPGKELMNHVAKGVMQHLSLALPEETRLEALGEPFPEFEQPINPKIAQHFGWDFATTDTHYQIYGRTMTYARYVANYVLARQSGITDFIGFLQGASSAI
ncbi:WcbI family polysaccharide biosynthesis putative acetyltransferase [Pseudodesulfovibrio piezophilus]|uniref:Polysaccharide biosynthesis enzyme WcbI domain-containing protein n=1 Tax=Pseudodesulfovibrio piezophilus (strain DSM 21447 / JCM 15486 / C1TLV30) TaxID=1322246 RepID=M1WKQ9_PSEP2|nr:WcbI family polysaccharide biosynthesis putative acetyltransferase [Pseudodesulfovibrio piezophilus]CCH50031.1 conserved protein of unknown function [Pseudodesulfovibrio piezophilus C1TLV30]